MESTLQVVLDPLERPEKQWIDCCRSKAKVGVLVRQVCKLAQEEKSSQVKLKAEIVLEAKAIDWQVSKAISIIYFLEEMYCNTLFERVVIKE